MGKLREEFEKESKLNVYIGIEKQSYQQFSAEYVRWLEKRLESIEAENTEEEKSINFLRSLFLICPEDKTGAVIISTKSGFHGTEIITKSEGNLKFKYIVTCSEIK